MEQILLKLLSSLTDPVNLILLLWIWFFIKERGDLIEINSKLLDAQQNRGETLAKITVMIEALMRDSRRAE